MGIRGSLLGSIIVPGRKNRGGLRQYALYPATTGCIQLNYASVGKLAYHAIISRNRVETLASRTFRAAPETILQPREKIGEVPRAPLGISSRISNARVPISEIFILLPTTVKFIPGTAVEYNTGNAFGSVLRVRVYQHTRSRPVYAATSILEQSWPAIKIFYTCPGPGKQDKIILGRRHPSPAASLLPPQRVLLAGQNRAINRRTHSIIADFEYYYVFGGSEIS